MGYVFHAKWLLFFLVYFLLLSAAPTWAESSLPASVAKELSAAGIPHGAVSIIVQPVEARGPTVEINGQQPMNPASTLKLVTTLSALEILGPAHVWTTEVWAVAPVEKGVLAGDLYFKGSGDPHLTVERFWLLLRELRARGVHEIRGDLVLDRTAIVSGKEYPAAFDGKSMRPYNVVPEALLLNFKAIRLTLNPQADSVQVLSEPTPTTLTLINRLRLTRNGCGDWQEGLRAEATDQNGHTQLVLSGAFAASCGEKVWHVAPMSGDRYFLGVFADLWRGMGGRFEGSVREEPVPLNARLLAVTTSPVLAQVVRDINKFSNNVMARQLYLSLGQDGAVRRWLASRGLDFPELVLENGAGLSRRERISAAHLAKVLSEAWHSPVMPELMSSLPIVAIDGTMKKRLKENGVAGRAHIKTGYLEGVRAIAGYVLDAKGRRQIVVCLINHPNARAAQPALDALLIWVYDS
ncbi:MAG: D-alanyl-D-alanine carboxypeptidase/D-alanyl-D-alanine-endopeptidase [Rhodocyclaceae bacterium]|nr:D-alanyl-D-alanine carboxypeptidase/D-alanyl-D-alanine-endopeptidase [Rhodocyclaceae bacterium]